MTARTTDDSLLARRVRERDPEALEEIVRLYLPQLVRAARAAGLSFQEADDAAQSTFITCFEKAETFEGRSLVRTWLFGILFRKVMEAKRARDRNVQTEDIEEAMESRFGKNGAWLIPPRSADAELEGREVREQIEECLDATPVRQRMAFVLREVEGMTTDEICKILEISDTNLGVLMYRARNRLRECLEAKGIWG